MSECQQLRYVELFAKYDDDDDDGTELSICSHVNSLVTIIIYLS